MPSGAAPRADSHPKPPAQPAIAKPADPIKAPVFSPVDDDPFAVRPPATATPKQPEPADDPFAPLKPAPAPQSKPAKPIVAEPTTLKIADGLIPGVDGRLPVRDWSDTSGQFRVKARLISIQGGQVRLLKETGRTTTAATERLSAADRQYLSEVITRYGNDLTKLDQFAAR
jgi:hypothetical protein